jgi:hypothetical protein
MTDLLATYMSVPLRHQTEDEELLRMFVYRYQMELRDAATPLPKDNPRRAVLLAQMDALEKVLEVMDGIQMQGRNYF